MPLNSILTGNVRFVPISLIVKVMLVRGCKVAVIISILLPMIRFRCTVSVSYTHLEPTRPY